jgi:hypothetical protein
MNIKNVKDEYLNAASLGDDLLGAIVFVSPQDRAGFLKDFRHLNVPLNECFHVTDVRKIFENRCSIIHGMTVYEVDPRYFKTRNPDFKPYG